MAAKNRTGIGAAILAAILSVGAAQAMAAVAVSPPTSVAMHNTVAHKEKHKTEKAAAADQQPAGFHKLLDVLAWSYANNPSLLSARAGFRAAEEALPQALSGWQPSVSGSGNITGESITGSGAANGTTSRQLGAALTQPLFHGGQTLAAVKSARASIEAQRALLRDREQQVLLQAATAYMNVVRDQSLLHVSEKNVTDLDQQLKASRGRFKVGDITKTDVSQAEAALAKAQADRTAALGNLKTSNAVFEELVGFPPGSVGQPGLPLPIPPTVDDAMDFADRYNPQVVAAAWLQKSSQSDVDRIFGQRLPQLNLVGGVARNYQPQPGGEPDNTTKTLGLTATIPLYTGGLLRSQVRQAKYTANQRYLDILDTRRQVRESVVGGWETLAATRAEIDSRQAQVKASRLALDGIRQETAVGTRTGLDELDTEQTWLSAEVSLVTARRDEVVAAAMGLLTPEGLGFPEIAGDEKGPYFLKSPEAPPF